METTTKQVQSTTQLGDNRRTKTRIRVCIPQHLHSFPVISQLISECGVTVNIAAAQLGGSIPQDGCFELELRGTADQIQDALNYLEELKLEIWYQSTEEDGW